MIKLKKIKFKKIILSGKVGCKIASIFGVGIDIYFIIFGYKMIINNRILPSRIYFKAIVGSIMNKDISDFERG